MPTLHKKFVELFDKIKPKLHHMHHILDAMDWIGKCLFCFVTERRHRDIKGIALHVFRNVEHAVVVDVVNQMCEQIASGYDLFQPMLLVEPHACKLQPDVRTSTRAVVHCGALAKKDIVFLEDMTCARAIAFLLSSPRSTLSN